MSPHLRPSSLFPALLLVALHLGDGQDVPTGMIISGGGQALGSWVEVYVPSTGHSCVFPSLPVTPREDHTMNNLIICGGYDFYARDDCIEFIDGEWTQLTSTLEHRDSHSSWLTSEGLILMGGNYNMTNSEIIPFDGGEPKSGFTMMHDVR